LEIHFVWSCPLRALRPSREVLLLEVAQAGSVCHGGLLAAGISFFHHFSALREALGGFFGLTFSLPHCSFAA
jgi:hypothetical protein